MWGAAHVGKGAQDCRGRGMWDRWGLVGTACGGPDMWNGWGWGQGLQAMGMWDGGSGGPGLRGRGIWDELGGVRASQAAGPPGEPAGCSGPRTKDSHVGKMEPHSSISTFLLYHHHRRRLFPVVCITPTQR